MVRAYEIIEFKGVSGTLLAPESGGHAFVAVRHSAHQPPWSDPGLHMHARSDEIYLVLGGRLDLIVARGSISVSPGELGFVRAGVPHGVVGGAGRIEHFGFRAPAVDDRRACFPTRESGQTSSADWGVHLRLDDPAHRNTWLLGVGSARFVSPRFLFASLDFPTRQKATAGPGTRLPMHAHRESWEHYPCLRGSKRLQVAGDTVDVNPGQLLVVHAGVRHTVTDRTAPYRAFTFRAPIREDKVLG